MNSRFLSKLAREVLERNAVKKAISIKKTKSPPRQKTPPPPPRKTKSPPPRDLVKNPYSKVELDAIEQNRKRREIAAKIEIKREELRVLYEQLERFLRAVEVKKAGSKSLSSF